ncbi:MAG TPA: FtsQ-type POTRA domain-containing protein [Candidatus Lumbricidophila sp.]|nr:FtsQ-type POTRA domain-containing protein [Candidatus Lumbricidophila sp.]
MAPATTPAASEAVLTVSSTLAPPEARLGAALVLPDAQSDAVARPTRETAGPAEVPGLEFDGDRMLTAPIPLIRPAAPAAPDQDASTEVNPELDASGPVRPALSVRQAQRERRRVERRELKRFTADRRRRRRNWLIGAGSVLGVTAVILAIAYSPLMALRAIRIEGATKVSVPELQQALASSLGTPLPMLRSSDIQAALQRFPLLESYTTEIIPPSTLVVRVIERQPIGVVKHGDRYDVVDAAGVLLDQVASRPAGYALIDAGDTGGTGFRAAAAVMRSLPAEVRAQVVEVTAQTADDVRLTLAGNVQVLWGNESDVALKASVLAKLMAAAPPKSVNQYDVSSPLAPTTR